MGFRFTTVMAAYWQRVIDWKWNYERPIVFAHVVLTRNLSTCKASYILAKIDRLLDLWGGGIHAGLV